MSPYFPKPYERFDGKNDVKVDLTCLIMQQKQI